ncbi:transcriptional regulator LdtR [Parvularcula sp. LCG005]|uniref:transcriptional regulator LdtR n=1 Tax=Parvularcula sp. LCG005 TaxID=3078805 RepID=UPI0029438C74|nr:winged helix DNA-binding protein [Parvularcula sp. LCG005]WOI52376.1 winged helix DNA-binding protein [Parvularcula sp. LCG005]
MRSNLSVTSVADDAEPSTELEGSYLKLLTLIERLHRQLLDVIKDELDRMGQKDINAVQALLLYNIGDAELTAGELRTRGHYLGSNVSYNLKKLVEAGYISHKRSNADRRSVRVSLTDEGLDVREQLSALFQRHLGSVEKVGDVAVPMVKTTNLTLERMERFWADQIRFQL